MACGTVDCWKWIQRGGRQIGRCCSSYWWSKCSLGRCGRLENLEGPWTTTYGMLLVIGSAGGATEVTTGMLGGEVVVWTTLLTEVCAAVVTVLAFASNILVFVELVPYFQHSLKRLVAVYRNCVWESERSYSSGRSVSVASACFLQLSSSSCSTHGLFWVVDSLA